MLPTYDASAGSVTPECLDRVPLDGHAVAAVGPDHLHVVPDALGRLLVLQAREDRLRAALARPARRIATSVVQPGV